jgi:gliding motility-associated lipoprotein GldH
MRQKNHPWLFALILLTVALVTTSCNRKAVYSHYISTPIDGWNASDELTFTISPIPADGTYEERIGLRINRAYPFQGLSLIVRQQVFPTGETLTDTLEASLIDHEGNIKGQGINYFQYTIPLRHIELHAEDSMSVSIRHYMRRETLPGIGDIGFTLLRLHQVSPSVDTKENEQEKGEAPQRRTSIGEER